MGAVRLIQATVLAMVLATGFQAQANKVIAKSKDWVLTDYSTAQDPNGNCVASTAEKLKKNEARLEVYTKKGSRQILEVIVRQTGEDFGHQGLFLSSKDGTYKIAAAPLSKDVKNQFFWIVPQNTDLFIHHIASNDLKVVSIGGTRALDFKFSRDGAAKIFQEMQRLCTNGPTINTSFEQTFLSGSSQIVDPSRLDAATVQALRQMYHQGHKLFLQKLDNQDQLGKLSQQYANEINEMNNLISLITRLEKQDIPRLESQISQTEATRIQSEKELAAVRAAIPGLAQAEQKAEAHLKAMEAIVAPLRPEYN